MNMKAFSTKVLPICAAVAMAFSVTSAQAANIVPNDQLVSSFGSDFYFPTTGAVTNLPLNGSRTFGKFIPGSIFGLTPLTQNPNYSFANFIDIHISAPSLLNGVFVSLDQIPQFKITNFQVNIFSGPGFTKLLSPANPLVLSSTNTTVGPLHKAVLATTALPVGDYTIQVLGLVKGTYGAGWTGSINTVPAPVPVPAAVWLLGSALTSVVVTRRRKASV